MIRKIFSSIIAKNAGWLIGGRIAQMIINFFVGILTARYLGPSNYGVINYVSAYAAFFTAICTLGINSILVKELLDHPNEEGKIIGSTLTLRAVSSFLSACVIVCLVSIVDNDEPVTIQVAILYSIGLLFQIFDTFNYWFQSKLKSKVTAIVSFVAYVLVALYKIALLILEKSVVWFALSTALDYFCIGVLLVLSYFRNRGQKLLFSKAVSRRILGESIHFILPALMVSIYGYTDKLMLKHMLGELEVGYYATATSLSSVWSFVLAAIIDAFYPIIMESHNINYETYKKRNRQLYAIVFYLSVVVSLGFCVFGKIIVNILYGEQYLPAVGPLRVIAWYTAFSYLGVARNAWIVSEGKQRYLKYVYASSALINVFLNLLFIPFCGTVGAALASLITQIATVIAVPLVVKPLRENTKLICDAILLRGIR